MKKQTYTLEELKQAHAASYANRETILRSHLCGCFACRAIYEPADIEEYYPDKAGDTAFCPFCGIDSVIGDASGYPITDAFLTRMHEVYFSPHSDNEEEDC